MTLRGVSAVIGTSAIPVSHPPPPALSPSESPTVVGLSWRGGWVGCGATFGTGEKGKSFLASGFSYRFRPPESVIGHRSRRTRQGKVGWACGQPVCDRIEKEKREGKREGDTLFFLEATRKTKREAASRRQVRERPDLGVDDYVEKVASIIGIRLEDLKGRGKGNEVSRARELLAALGGERYDLRVKDIAQYLDKRPVTVTGWVMRGVRRRAEDPETAARIDALDGGLCKKSEKED